MQTQIELANNFAQLIERTGSNCGRPVKQVLVAKSTEYTSKYAVFVVLDDGEGWLAVERYEQKPTGFRLIQSEVIYETDSLSDEMANQKYKVTN